MTRGPNELRPVVSLSPEQREAGWKTQVELEDELREQLARDVTEGLLTQEELAQAEQDIDIEAEWVRHL